LPPQPINASMLMMSAIRKNENFRAVLCCFKGIAPALCLRSTLRSISWKGPWVMVCHY